MIAYNTALIVLGTNAQPEERLVEVLEYLKPLGTMIKYSEIICTRFLRPVDQGNYLNEAVLMQTDLSLDCLETKLRAIENTMNVDSTQRPNELFNMDLDLVTYDGVIVNKSKIIKYPFLFDFIKVLQPELFVWK